jgi:hypothetical protein
MDTTSMRRSTRLNKNLEGFKTKRATVGLVDDRIHVGRFDHGSADGVPLELSKENLQAIGSGFLKIQPILMTMHHKVHPAQGSSIWGVIGHSQFVSLALLVGMEMMLPLSFMILSLLFGYLFL